MRMVPQLSMVMAVALVEALRTLTAGRAALSIKWPNDVLLGGRKLAGILIEGSTLPDGRFACVAGIGVNCLVAPELAAYPAASLAGAGFPITPARLMPALSEAFANCLELWARGTGFAAIRDLWLDSAAFMGEPIRVSQGGSSEAGMFAGLDEGGRLLLDTPAGRKTIDAADIGLPDAATGASRLEG